MDKVHFRLEKDLRAYLQGIMKVISLTLVCIITLINWGCTKEFIPEIKESPYCVVVDGLITNQPEVYTVNLSWSYPVLENTSFPMTGCEVSVLDDLGNVFKFSESSTPGTYNSDRNTFQGVVGRTYRLHINSKNATPKHYSYESFPVEMKSVPPIDSLYYEKVLIEEATLEDVAKEGCQVYLNTYDPEGDCRYFRWDFTETWKCQIPFDNVVNKTCWISNNSYRINIKNTSSLSESLVNRHPVVYISNETDRLSIRYSINVNQYSMSEDEFQYWEDITEITENVGSLYDIIPYSLNGNLFCVEDPDEQVLGYLSVSAKTSKRIYIDERFSGLEDIYYPECLEAELDAYTPWEMAGETWWIVYNLGTPYITHQKWCVDCTARGTLFRPEFWEDPGYK